MKGPTVIGLILLAAGAILWYVTPHNVTWGNHHYVRHILSYGLLGLGAIFTLVGARGRS